MRHSVSEPVVPLASPSSLLRQPGVSRFSYCDGRLAIQPACGQQTTQTVSWPRLGSCQVQAGRFPPLSGLLEKDRVPAWDPLGTEGGWIKVYL